MDIFLTRELCVTATDIEFMLINQALDSILQQLRTSAECDDFDERAHTGMPLAYQSVWRAHSTGRRGHPSVAARC
jgi:hypothetical protein